MLSVGRVRGLGLPAACHWLNAWTVHVFPLIQYVKSQREVLLTTRYVPWGSWDVFATQLELDRPTLQTHISEAFFDLGRFHKCRDWFLLDPEIGSNPRFFPGFDSSVVSCPPWWSYCNDPCCRSSQGGHRIASSFFSDKTDQTCHDGTWLRGINSRWSHLVLCDGSQGWEWQSNGWIGTSRTSSAPRWFHAKGGWGYEFGKGIISLYFLLVSNTFSRSSIPLSS